MNNFCKNPMQRITNERIRAKIKLYIDQVDIDGITTIMLLWIWLTLVNLMQSISSQFILFETLRIDISSKIESSLIELHFIDEKEVY